MQGYRYRNFCNPIEENGDLRCGNYYDENRNDMRPKSFIHNVQERSRQLEEEKREWKRLSQVDTVCQTEINRSSQVDYFNPPLCVDYELKDIGTFSIKDRKQHLY